MRLISFQIHQPGETGENLGFLKYECSTTEMPPNRFLTSNRRVLFHVFLICFFCKIKCNQRSHLELVFLLKAYYKKVHVSGNE